MQYRTCRSGQEARARRSCARGEADIFALRSAICRGALSRRMQNALGRGIDFWTLRVFICYSPTYLYKSMAYFTELTATMALCGQCLWALQNQSRGRDRTQSEVRLVEGAYPCVQNSIAYFTELTAAMARSVNSAYGPSSTNRVGATTCRV